MAYYQYYQSQPNYGTSAYQVVMPPTPSYQPQPSWTGSDYYRAHAGYGGGVGGASYDDGLDVSRRGVSPPVDSGIFDWVWSRMKSIVGGGGVSRDEARHWHKRVYGGMVSFLSDLFLVHPLISLATQVDITQLLPAELGGAAGYEAMRLWEHHNSVYRSPLMDDREREREALVGLAIAEGNYRFPYAPIYLIRICADAVLFASHQTLVILQSPS